MPDDNEILERDSAATGNGGRGGGAADAAPGRTRRGRRNPTGEIRRVNIAINVAVQLLCALFLFYLLNAMANRNYKRWDMSAAKKYSISEDSASYLSRLDSEVTLTMAFYAGSRIRSQLEALLLQYERLGGGKVTFENIDLGRDKARALEIADRYKMPIEKSTLFVDVGGKVKRITEIDMLDDHGRRFAGEAAVTSAMLAATEGRPKTVYLIAGKGKLREVDKRTALEELLDLSRRQFFTLKELTLGNVTEIPADADALLLINPSTDLSTSEVALLSDYWENRNGSLVMLLNPATAMRNLAPFLRSHGLRIDSDHRVLFSQVLGIGGSRKVYEVQAKFLDGSPITTEDKGTITTFGGQTCPLSVAEDNKALAAKGIIAKALLEADERFWGDLDHTETIPAPGPGDMQPPVYVAASVEKGGFDDPAVQLESSRMVVVGNSTLLDPDHITQANAGFVLNSLNWALDRDGRLDIMTKPTVSFPVSITEQQKGNLFMLVVILLPTAALSFAIFVWSARRN